MAKSQSPGGNKPSGNSNPANKDKKKNVAQMPNPATPAPNTVADSAKSVFAEASGSQKKTDPKPLHSAAVDLESAIRQRAYDIYQERGGAQGNPHEDWARAEREVRASLESKSQEEVQATTSQSTDIQTKRSA
jgi:hypothetical protein